MHSMMGPNSVKRLVYDGADPSDDWVVQRLGHSELNPSKVHKVHISSMSDFEAGCKEHDGCLGHMGISKSGLLLPPHSLSVHNIIMSNSVYSAVSYAMRGSEEFWKRRYIEALAASMKRKTGHMRKGIVNAHVDGSLRMVITPQWDHGYNTVMIPEYLQGKWMVCRFDPGTNLYKSMPVEDGDNAIAVRPPSLQASSVQPVKIRFWRHTCMGINPELVSAFHGDYDGDEMHLYPVYSAAAVRECQQWNSTPNRTFHEAREIYRGTSIFNGETGQADHMMSTTMSFTQILNGDEAPLMSHQTRMKQEHIASFRERMRNPEMMRAKFDSESIRGMSDINNQQLFQPIVGDMSRIARIVASCYQVDNKGIAGIESLGGFEPIRRLLPDVSAGNTAVRALSTVCAAAQQAALDSHRVKSESMLSHDLIRDMVVGSDTTLVALSRPARLSDDIVWRHSKGSFHYALCKRTASYSMTDSDIVAAYSPMFLSVVRPEHRYNVCRRGIVMVVNYYSIRLTSHEIDSMAVLYSHMADASPSPITSKLGAYARDLQWVETAMIKHYVGMVGASKSGKTPLSAVKTASACLMAANFAGAQ